MEGAVSPLVVVVLVGLTPAQPHRRYDDLSLVGTGLRAAMGDIFLSTLVFLQRRLEAKRSCYLICSLGTQDLCQAVRMPRDTGQQKIEHTQRYHWSFGKSKLMASNGRRQILQSTRGNQICLGVNCNIVPHEKLSSSMRSHCHSATGERNTCDIACHWARWQGATYERLPSIGLDTRSPHSESAAPRRMVEL